MRRKKQLLTVALCASSMFGNSALVLAQDNVKRQEAKPTPGVRVSKAEPLGDIQSDVFWIADPPQDPTFQIATPAPPVPGMPGMPGMMASVAVPQVQFMTNEFGFDGKVVKGAPYSADAVTESIQMMSDGNRIVHNSSAKIYRDSVGRTRREQALNAVGAWAVSGETPTMIFINDPVAGVQYNLEPNSKTAMKISVQRLDVATADKNNATYTVSVAGRLADKTEGGEGQFKFVTDDNRTVIISDEAGEKAAVELKATEAKAREARLTGEVRARTNAVSMVSGVATGVGGSFTFSSDGEVNKESLGTQTIEGVQAEGTRVTFTIPAGKIGNERPIVSVNERWYSPELQAVVLSKNTDPRMGETTYRLTNIVRSEPDSGLFQLPSDYTVKEGGYSFTRSTDMIRKVEGVKRAGKPNDN
jgi:hypothetical protein